MAAERWRGLSCVMLVRGSHCAMLWFCGMRLLGAFFVDIFGC